MSVSFRGKPEQTIKTPIRVALAGAGTISRYHLIAWSKLNHIAKVVAICDPNLDRAKSRAEEFGVSAVFPSAQELFATQSIDAIDIASPRGTHVAWVRAAAERETAVLCQKPIAPTLGEAVSLERDVRGRIRVMVNENRRYNPMYRELKKWISDGLLGEIRLVRGAYLSSAFLPDNTGQTLYFTEHPDMAIEPRLFIAEAFIHQIDVTRFLCGPLRVIAARATRTLPDIPGETLASILMETANGTIVSLTGNMAAPGYPSRRVDEFDIIGDRASARVRDGTLELIGGESRRVDYDVDASAQACFDEAARHFVESLISGAPFESDLSDNLETLRLVEHSYWDAGLHKYG